MPKHWQRCKGFVSYHPCLRLCLYAGGVYCMQCTIAFQRPKMRIQLQPHPGLRIIPTSRTTRQRTASRSTLILQPLYGSLIPNQGPATHHAVPQLGAGHIAPPSTRPVHPDQRPRIHPPKPDTVIALSQPTHNPLAHPFRNRNHLRPHTPDPLSLGRNNTPSPHLSPSRSPPPRLTIRRPNLGIHPLPL